MIVDAMELTADARQYFAKALARAVVEREVVCVTDNHVNILCARRGWIFCGWAPGGIEVEPL